MPKKIKRKSPKTNMEKTVNLYQTTKESLYKSSCQLLSKCYKEGLKTLVITSDELNAQTLDNLLWSFAQKDFIPHALSTDQNFDEHPIIISYQGDETQINTNHFNTQVLIESFQNYSAEFKKTVIFFTQEKKDAALELKNSIKNATIKHYIQNEKGEWSLAR